MNQGLVWRFPRLLEKSVMNEWLKRDLWEGMVVSGIQGNLLISHRHIVRDHCHMHWPCERQEGIHWLATHTDQPCFWKTGIHCLSMKDRTECRERPSPGWSWFKIRGEALYVQFSPRKLIKAIGPSSSVFLMLTVVLVENKARIEPQTFYIFVCFSKELCPQQALNLGPPARTVWPLSVSGWFASTFLLFPLFIFIEY